MTIRFLFALVLAPVFATVTANGQQACDALKSVTVPRVTVSSAELAPAAAVAKLGTLPARCIVKAIARPTPDSEIRIEVWLPQEWNGRYQQVGNGGFAGAIPISSLNLAVSRGYATAGTDDGHQAGMTDAAWAIGHPEKVIDFAYRAVHQTSIVAKAMINAFYGKPATRHYFVGCSDGGREALMEAQRYPEDFDGIVAGAPANDWNHLLAKSLWNEQALIALPGSNIPPAKLPAIQRAVLAQCDAIDGVKDGLIGDPRACKFDHTVLTCKGKEDDNCLAGGQLVAIEKILMGPRHPLTGKQIYPALPPGSEAYWKDWITTDNGRAPLGFAFANSYFGSVVNETKDWDFTSFRFETDLQPAYEKAGWLIGSNSPDLRSFRARGGKLIQYHGWADPAIPGGASVDYYERVRAFFAAKPDPRTTSGGLGDFYRLFMVPGLAHCGGGTGPINFGNTGETVPRDAEHDLLTAIETWVEKGTAPERLIGTGPAAMNPAQTMTRPLCPHPQVARYSGSGDVNDAANFTCASPR